jgi:fatty-acyl-CoA synthase
MFREQAAMAGNGISPYELDLGRNAANHQPLTPLSQIERAAAIWPEHTAVIHGRQTHSYHELYARSIWDSGVSGW